MTNPLDTTRTAKGYGRWCFAPQSSHMVFSALAAGYLHVEALHHAGLDSCFIPVVSDDILDLIAPPAAGRHSGQAPG